METNKIFLTFDMDWAIDEVLRDLYDLLCDLDVCGTIHVTHETELLDAFRKDDRLELGIHPNYNMLLDGTARSGSCESILSELLKIVPEAVTVRGHALTIGSVISSKYVQYGLKYDLDIFYPPECNDRIQCFKDVYGLYKIPFLFEDDIYMGYPEKKDISYYLSDEFVAPRVFNFHPIHIFLNSDSNDRYENARPYFKDYTKLREYRNTTRYGIRDFFVDLVEYARRRNYTFLKIKENEWGTD